MRGRAGFHIDHTRLGRPEIGSPCYATAACERRSAHFARAQFRALARYKRAGRIEERDGKLDATQSTGTEQRTAV